MLYAHAPADITPAAFRAHLAHKSASQPMTERERERADIRQAEGVTAAGTTERRDATGADIKGVLEWTDEAKEAVRALAGDVADGSCVCLVRR